MRSVQDLNFPPFNPETYHQDTAAYFDAMFGIVEAAIRAQSNEEAVFHLRRCQKAVGFYCELNQLMDDAACGREKEKGLGKTSLLDLLRDIRPE